MVDVPIGSLRVNPWSLGLVNYVGSAVVGLAWPLFVVGTEAYFRNLRESSPEVVATRVAKILAAEHCPWARYIVGIC